MNEWFITNTSGTCLTWKGLEDLLPRDDRETPPLDSYAYDILFESKGKIIPDCKPDTLHLDQEMSAHGIDLLTAVFDAPPLPQVPEIPLGDAQLFMITVIVGIVWAAFKKE